jgi:hypothetical protein
MEILESIKERGLFSRIVLVIVSLVLYYQLEDQILNLLNNNLIKPIETAIQSVEKLPQEQQKVETLITQMKSIASIARQEIGRIGSRLFLVTFVLAVTTMGLITYATILRKKDKLLQRDIQEFEKTKKDYEKGIEKETEGIEVSIAKIEKRKEELEIEKKRFSEFIVADNFESIEETMKELFFKNKKNPILIIGNLGQGAVRPFLQLAEKYGSQLMLVKTSIDRHEKEYIPYENNAIEAYLTSYKQAFDHVYFFDSHIVLQSDDRFIIVPSGTNRVQDMINYWKANSVRLSFSVKTDYLADVHHLLSERAMNEINLDGYAYKANKSRLWLEQPTDMFKTFPAKASEYKKEITSHFLEFEKDFSQEAERIIAVWPLTQASINLNLHQDESINEWLRDLKTVATEKAKVDRFLLISGDRYGDGQRWDYKLFDNKEYKDKLLKIIEDHFIKDLPENYKVYCVLCGTDNRRKIGDDILKHFTTDLPSFKKIRAKNRDSAFLNMEDELHSNWVMFNCRPYSILQYEEIFEYQTNQSLPLFYYHEEGTINGGRQTCDMALRTPQMLGNRCVRYMIYYDTLIEAMNFAGNPFYRKEHYVFPLTDDIFKK